MVKIHKKRAFKTRAKSRCHILSWRAMTISDFISLEFTTNEIVLLCSHHECFRQGLNASLKNNPFTFLNFKIVWCSWIKPNIQISLRLHSDSIDWSWSVLICTVNNLITWLSWKSILKKPDNLTLWNIFLATNFPVILPDEMKLKRIKFLILDIIQKQGGKIQNKVRTHWAKFCLFCEKICHQFAETSASGDF